MASCDANNLGGNSSAGFDRVLKWTILGTILGTLAAALNLTGPFGWVAFFTLLAGAVMGAGIGLFVGQMIDWFGRLHEQSPKTITMLGEAKCAGRNPFGLQPFTDGDWTTNLGDLTLASPAERAAAAPRIVLSASMPWTSSNCGASTARSSPRPHPTSKTRCRCSGRRVTIQG